ncbi:unnamed protein product [Rotaria sp. Silwood1]|nr:unnamed protein product [Rotaria sp. Silwood1]CAF1606190.1 unnamed protein product [Rotaria sp. Silwood1]CAF3672484.1 unnamed protein product [Rotaria sp. Silwood1]CAF4666412.1 unnamed protein product [Rotaria sp. Silwood1]
MLYETKSYPSEQTIYDKKLLINDRLTPIGDTSLHTEYDTSDNEEFNENIPLIKKHEKLNSSLAALTSHLAHVQLRLEQVISAPTLEDRENLLIELQKFATNGIPDVICQSSIFINDLTHEQLIEAEKSREKEFINELKQKLDELEHYAFASGSLECPPTLVIIEKQRILIDQLRQKLDLQLDDDIVSKLSAEELRKLVDQSIYQLTNPVKLKEKLINQMRTEINDLEKFIEFLKADSTKSKTDTTIASVPSSNSKTKSKPTTTTTSQSQSTNTFLSCFQFEHNSLNIYQSIKKFFILTQLYTIFFLTCGTRSMKRTTHQSTRIIIEDSISQEYFDNLRVDLDIAIEKVLHKVRLNKTLSIYLNNNDNNITIDTDEYKEYDHLDTIILSIRQDLAPALRALLEHGLYKTSSSTNLSVWSCFPLSSMNNYSTKKETMHIWKLMLKYYDMKSGYEFSNSPAHKLSQSFSLDIVGGKPITLTECLLNAIDTIMKLHQNHKKQQMDCCFKSFICYALNEKKLVLYLRLILQTVVLVENYYQTWSYTRQTGFNDALHSLDRLTSIDFNLPINTSVRRFMNNRDLIE